MIQYTYGEHQWHDQYQQWTQNASTETLRYVIQDCREALEAQPHGIKASQYMDEINYCSMALHKRATL